MNDPVLFLDFDGTLSPLKSHPDLVWLSDRQSDLLRAIAQRIPTVIISGRALPDLLKRVPGDSLAGVAGDHGASRIFRGKSYVQDEAKEVGSLIHQLSCQLQQHIQSWSGVHVEEKEYSISVHYRHLPTAQWAAFCESIEKVGSSPYFESLKISPGKCVWEFRHPMINKETALLWYLQKLAEEKGQARWTGQPIMIGDDTTDWMAIKTVIGLGGTGIWVGGTPPETGAPHPLHLSSPEDVWKWLESI
ncbi:MAG: trehalose-phosphatase [Leptospirales bacterium]